MRTWSACSTRPALYLDRPMRNPTLSQTLARAHRAFPGKEHGLIVDYVGLFRDPRRASAISGGGVGPRELSVQDKAALVFELEAALVEVAVFLTRRGIELDAQRRKGLRRQKLIAAVDHLLTEEESRRRFFALARALRRRYQAVLPDLTADRLAPRCALVERLAESMRAVTPHCDIYEVMAEVDSGFDSLATAARTDIIC